MAFLVAFKKLKTFICYILSVCKYTFSFLLPRKKRFIEGDESVSTLTQVKVVSNSSKSSGYDHCGENQSWEWKDDINKGDTHKPMSIQEHIDHYRQRAIAARQQQEDIEEQEKFFDDMTPEITRQKKLFVKVDNEESNLPSRLLAEGSSLVSQDLEEWDDNIGWEGETLDVDAKEVLKENRKLARQKRLWEQQQQKKQEKLIKPTLGSKIT